MAWHRHICQRNVSSVWQQLLIKVIRDVHIRYAVDQDLHGWQVIRCPWAQNMLSASICLVDMMRVLRPVHTTGVHGPSARPVFTAGESRVVWTGACVHGPVHGCKKCQPWTWAANTVLILDTRAHDPCAWAVNSVDRHLNTACVHGPCWKIALSCNAFFNMAVPGSHSCVHNWRFWHPWTWAMNMGSVYWPSGICWRHICLIDGVALNDYFYITCIKTAYCPIWHCRRSTNPLQTKKKRNKNQLKVLKRSFKHLLKKQR